MYNVRAKLIHIEAKFAEVWVKLFFSLLSIKLLALINVLHVTCTEAYCAIENVTEP